MSKESYKKLKENGICPSCRKPIDTQGVYCTECAKKRNEQSRNNYQFFKEIGLCVRCHKKIMGTETLCPECRAIQATKTERYINKNRELHNEKQRIYRKERYTKLKEQGICVRCGKRNAIQGRVMCEWCLAKTLQYQKQKRGEKVSREFSEISNEND